MLHFLSHVAKTDWSQAQQSLLSSLIVPGPYPWLRFRCLVNTCNKHLVDPFMRVTNLMTRHMGYLKRIVITPAYYPRLSELHHVDIQNTGKKSHGVNTFLKASQCLAFIRQSDSLCPLHF